MSTFTAHERQRFAIVKAHERRTAELSPMLAEIDRLVVEVGWPQARPVAAGVLGPHVRVSGPRGRWRGRVGKRTGARLVAELGRLPAQGRLALDPPSHPRPTLDPRRSPR